uniref:hypothetical protein n=1 Tax=Agathobacter sp. TaxID=2021311 RepID=UPI004056F8F3
MKSRIKKIKVSFALLLMLTMVFTLQTTVLAAGTPSKTVKSTKAMSVALLPGETGDSNTITFNFSGLPENAIVKEVEIDCSNATASGKGAILPESLTIAAPSGEMQTVSWGSGNITSTSLFIAEEAAGVWSVYMTGTNILPSSAGSAYVGAVKYTSVEMTITYIEE